MPDGTGFSDANDALIRQAAGISRESDELSKQMGESAKLKRGIAERFLSDRPPPPPNVPSPPEPPKPADITEPVKAFGSIASALAVFGGLLTKEPLVASLNAASSAMNSIRQNDWDTYRVHYDNWKAQSDYAGKLQDWQIGRYKTAMEQYKGDHDSMVAALNTLAAADQDTLAQHTLRTGDFRLFSDMLRDRQGMVDKYRDYSLRLDEFAQRKAEFGQRQAAAADVRNTPERQTYDAFLRENPEATAEQRAAFLKQTRGTDPAATKWEVVTDPGTGTQYRYNPLTAAKTKLDGQPFAPGEEPKGLQKVGAAPRPNELLETFKKEHSGDNEGKGPTAEEQASFTQSMRAPRSAQAIATQKFMQENKDAKADDVARFASDYAAKVSGGRAFAVGPEAKTKKSMEVGISHLETLGELSDALQNSDWKTMNSLSNTLESEFGDPRVTNFDTAKEIVGAEVTKAIVGGLGTGGDREGLKSNFIAARSPEQLRGVVDTLKKLMGGQLTGLANQYKGIFGEDQTFYSKLAPSALKALGRGPDGGAAAPSAGETGKPAGGKASPSLPPAASRVAGKTTWTAPSGQNYLWNGSGWDEVQ